MSPSTPPLTITGERYRWELHHHEASDLYGAVLRPLRDHEVGPHRYGDPIWSVTAYYSSDLEVLCGFGLPASGHRYLRDSDTPGAPRDQPPIGPAPLPGDCQPQRFDRVTIGSTVSTYGRWHHDDPNLVEWREGDYGIDILGPAGPAGYPGVTAIAYRVWHAGRIVAARANLGVPDRDATLPDWARRDDTVRAAVNAVTPELFGTPAAQREWMAGHGGALTGLVARPQPPYPPGCRVEVALGGYQRTTTGEIVAAVTTPGGELLGYRWRPHQYELPGHPYQGQADRDVFSRAGMVSPTLRSPDRAAGTLVAFGARVVTIDHPTVASGTVIHDMAWGGSRWLRIQPDEPGSPRVWLTRAEVTCVSGSAWQTVAALCRAREAEGISLQPGEVLATTTEIARVGVSGGRPVVGPVTRWDELDDPLLAPDSHDLNADFTDLARVPATVGGHLLIEDDVRPFMLAPDDQATPMPPLAYPLARALPPATLRDLLARTRPDLLPAPGPAPAADVHRLLAAAVATHLADELPKFIPGRPDSPPLPGGPQPPGL